MYCESCGKNIPDESKFCEYCGSKVISESRIHIEKDTDNIIEYEQEIEEMEENESIQELPEEEIKISKNITMTSEGSYNWMYEFSLWKNPTIFITVFKVLLISMMFPAMLMFFLSLGEGIGEAFKILVSILGIGAVLISVLTILGYVIIGLVYGGKYYVLFKMDNKGINHIQLDKQHKKAQALGFLTALVGASSKNVTAVGAGLLAASKKSMYTNFKKVKSVKFSPRTNTIYLNESLNKNQIYVSKEDYEFVKEFILANCPKNIKR